MTVRDLPTPPVGNPTVWKNRIVESGFENPEQLLANPLNWRIHPKHQQDALEAVLDEVGFVTRVLVNKTTGFVVDGHLRVALGISRGESAIPVDYLDLSEQEEALVLATFDSISAMAGMDKDKLKALLATAQPKTDNAKAALEKLAKDNGIAGETSVTDAEAQVDKADELREKWATSEGQVWQLGRHRLACISSTDENAVKSFLKDVTVKMVFADPPYGVSVVKENKVGAVFNESVAKKGEYATIIGDETIETAQVSSAMCLSLFAKAIQIWWGANYYAHCLPPSSGWVVWDKRDGTVIDNTFSDCELAWTSVNTKIHIHRQLWNGMIRAGEHGKRVHPTQKPIALAHWCFTEFGNDGDVIYDPFAGSGISIIAGEQLQRTVYATELSPEYIAVIIQRWHEMTGLTPQLVTK